MCVTISTFLKIWNPSKATLTKYCSSFIKWCLVETSFVLVKNTYIENTNFVTCTEGHVAVYLIANCLLYFSFPVLRIGQQKSLIFAKESCNLLG